MEATSPRAPPSAPSFPPLPKTPDARWCWPEQRAGATPGVGPVAPLSQLRHWAATLLGMRAYSNLCVFKLDTVRQSLVTRIYSGTSPMDPHVDTNKLTWPKLPAPHAES